jgi:hypothetical protein
MSNITLYKNKLLPEPGDLILSSNNPRSCWKLLLAAILYILIWVTWQFFDSATLYAKESRAELGPYEVIISKDPFDPERGKNQPVTSAIESDLKGHCQVYGTVIMGEVRKAFIVTTDSEKDSNLQKKRTKGLQKDIRTVNIGDIVEGWRVKDITDKGVKFESDGRCIEIAIFDEIKKERKATGSVTAQSPRPDTRVIRAPQSLPAKRP